MRGTGNAPEPLHARRFAELNERLVRLIAAVSSVAMILLGFAGLILRDNDFVIQAIGAGFIATVSWFQVVLKRMDAGVLLSVIG